LTSWYQEELHGVGSNCWSSTLDKNFSATPLFSFWHVIQCAFTIETLCRIRSPAWQMSLTVINIRYGGGGVRWWTVMMTMNSNNDD